MIIRIGNIREKKNIMFYFGIKQLDLLNNLRYELGITTVELCDSNDNLKFEIITFVRRYEIGLIDYLIELWGSIKIIN